jgi:hypothetical protein
MFGFLRDLVAQGGMWTSVGSSFKGSVDNNVTALGSTQGTAYQITKNVTNVTTAALNTGVIVPANLSVNDVVVVRNGGANALAVYPQSGGQINAAGANTALSVAVGKTAILISLDGLNFIALAGA